MAVDEPALPSVPESSATVTITSVSSGSGDVARGMPVTDRHLTGTVVDEGANSELRAFGSNDAALTVRT